MSQPNLLLITVSTEYYADLLTRWLWIVIMSECSFKDKRKVEKGTLKYFFLANWSDRPQESSSPSQTTEACCKFCQVMPDECPTFWPRRSYSCPVRSRRRRCGCWPACRRRRGGANSLSISQSSFARSFVCERCTYIQQFWSIFKPNGLVYQGQHIGHSLWQIWVFFTKFLYFGIECHAFS